MSDPSVHKRFIYYIFSLLILCFLAGCEKENTSSGWKTTGSQNPQDTNSDEQTLTIGDIDPDTPRLRMLKLRPLASHMARELGWKESQIKIRIVKSIEEAARLISAGEIDLFMDSSYPSMLVQQLSNAQIFLEIPVQGKRSYKSLILASNKSEIKSLDDLDRKTISLQELYSTSGFLLPADLLLHKGYNLVPLNYHIGPEETKTIKIIFSGDEENTLIMIRNGAVSAGALSSEDYEQLSPELQSEFVILAETITVPRKFASIRQGFDSDLFDRLQKVLLAISDEDRTRMLSENGWSWKFVPLDQQSQDGIKNITEMIKHSGPYKDKLIQ